MILADTSAWVEYDRATGSPVNRRLTELIGTDGPLAVTEPVVMEVVAGARSDERVADLRRLLLRGDGGAGGADDGCRSGGRSMLSDAFSFYNFDCFQQL